MIATVVRTIDDFRGREVFVVSDVKEVTHLVEEYQLRRLWLRGLIQRIPQTHCYEVTDAGLRAALFYTSSFSQVIRPQSTILNEDNFRQRLLKQLRQLVKKTAL